MQKAFDLIIERAIEQGDIPFSYIPYTKVISIGELSNVVNQVAEEYKHVTTCYLQSPCEYQNEDVRIPEEEVCEWKQCGGNLRPYQTTSCEKFALHDISYVYCPYCGKRIFVKE